MPACILADYCNKPLLNRCNKSLPNRAWVIFLLFALLSAAPAAAQVSDTVRVGQDTVAVGQDTVGVGQDTAHGQEATGQGAREADRMVLRSMPDSVVGNWQKDPDFAYANDPEYWRREKLNDTPGWAPRFFGSAGFRYFLLFFLGGVLLYAIIRIIAENNLRLFYRSPVKKKASVKEETASPLEEDLDGQLTHFLQIGDHRQAVRYLYLKSLRLLNDQGLIRFHQESTNEEYLGQLNATSQAPAFRALTGVYEKVWYGEFPLGEGQFAKIHGYFEDFFKTCLP
jgi:hypothetical protein